MTWPKSKQAIQRKSAENWLEIKLNAGEEMTMTYNRNESGENMTDY